jgi:hypothetical protein
MHFSEEEAEESDRHRCCHIQEGIAHALQAGEQAIGSFTSPPAKM